MLGDLATPEVRQQRVLATQSDAIKGDENIGQVGKDREALLHVLASMPFLRPQSTSSAHVDMPQPSDCLHRPGLLVDNLRKRELVHLAVDAPLPAFPRRGNRFLWTSGPSVCANPGIDQPGKLVHTSSEPTHSRSARLQGVETFQEAGH